MLRARKTERHLSASGLRFGIAAARYNTDLADALLANCLDTLAKAGADMRDIKVLKVPGSFEVTAARSETGPKRQVRLRDRVGRPVAGRNATCAAYW